MRGVLAEHRNNACGSKKFNESGWKFAFYFFHAIFKFAIWVEVMKLCTLSRARFKGSNTSVYSGLLSHEKLEPHDYSSFHFHWQTRNSSSNLNCPPIKSVPIQGGKLKKKLTRSSKVKRCARPICVSLQDHSTLLTYKNHLFYSLKTSLSLRWWTVNSVEDVSCMLDLNGLSRCWILLACTELAILLSSCLGLTRCLPRRISVFASCVT